jgi:hypothetical protein
MALTNLAHANGVIHHFMYHHSPEEVGAALMLARLEALPQQEEKAGWQSVDFTTR